MCFIDKKKMNWIRKEDRVSDPIRPSGQVGLGTGSEPSQYGIVFMYSFTSIILGHGS